MAITSPCPSCSEPIISNGLFVADCSFRVRCFNCEKLIEVHIGRINKVSVSSIKDEKKV